ncbi:microtubule-associated protein tau isoform X2 [Dendroctonus ponderosae]|uniref:microtubule-associated protein tau isoform X2 n=1 Tax=Dendroctonus ponderosae TaxID=77166 RepID=UPI0020353C54|nr:microtubule-associated protein tau isoform X2 [Dendroctonus ponderosae]
MAQQTVTNGPAIDGSHLKTGLTNPATPGNLPSEPVAQPQPGPFLVRSPLNRSDSRQNFQYRPPIPAGSGPQSINPSGPFPSSNQYIASSPQQARPFARSPVPSQPFVQRGPPLGPGGTGPRLPQANPGNYPAQNQQPRPVFRPQTPFPRSPLLAQRPQIFQQSSVPAFQRPRPTLEDSLNRSQTLDSAELDSQRYVEGDRVPAADQRPPSAASLGRSFSVSSSNPTLERKLTGSQEAIAVSRQSSLENVSTKEENVPPKPESRPGSRMGKISESEGKTEVIRAAETRGEVTNGDTPKSPKRESPVQVVNNPPPKQEEPKQEEQKKPELDLNLKSKKGDNDSGVDESTQGNDQSCNGDSRSPRKPSKSRTSSTTPTKGRSLSRGSKTPSSLQSPDSAATTPGSTEKKKVPMNKIQVGSAPSPNLKVVKSKIGSLDNAHYKPGGGKVKIESKKLDFKKAAPRIEAKNDKYVPKVGEKKEVQSARIERTAPATSRELCSARSAQGSTSSRKIITQKLEWNAKSKIGSLENAAHKPKGGDKKIESVKLNFKDKAAPKVGSKDNIKHQPGGGDVKNSGKRTESNLRSNCIESKKIEVNVTSKVGSLDNVKHKPAGGEKKIFDDKEYLKQRKSDKSSLEHSLSGSQEAGSVYSFY